MCLATVYKENDDSVIFKNVSRINVDGNKLVLRDIMGVLAENVLKNGGEVIGVEPQFFIDQGLEYKEITKLYEN